MSVLLEKQLQCQLSDPGVLRAGDAAETGGTLGDVRVVAVHAVGGIEEFGTELQFGSFTPDGEFLEDAGIPGHVRLSKPLSALLRRYYEPYRVGQVNHVAQLGGLKASYTGKIRAVQIRASEVRHGVYFRVGQVRVGKVRALEGTTVQRGALQIRAGKIRAAKGRFC